MKMLDRKMKTMRMIKVTTEILVGVMNSVMVEEVEVVVEAVVACRDL